MSATEANALAWEDADPTAGRWWISRARDTSTGAPRDVFIAEDDMTDALIGLLRIPPESNYTVIAATFLDRFESRAAAAAVLKGDVLSALPGIGGRRSAEVRRSLRRWRSIRLGIIARKNLPFLFLGAAAGALLGLAVALFATWTGLVGWPIVAAGIALGAAAGYFLKAAVEVTRATAASGPWGRFATIMLGASLGAGVTVAGALTAFWH